jgi:DNA-binding beta-propeller fold protein YncE
MNTQCILRNLLLLLLTTLALVVSATDSTISGHGKFLLSESAKPIVSESPAGPREYVLFESDPVRPLALSKDNKHLYVVNTPDNHLEIYALTEVGPIHRHSVPVGLEPVAVALNADGSQAWVINHLSDSASIVDLSSPLPRVERTLWLGDEPRDIVFAGSNFERAFITTAHRGQNSPVEPRLTTHGIGRADVWVFDSNNLGDTPGGTPETILTLFGDKPRALAANADGSRVYAAIFHSGNRTTTLPPPASGFNKAPPFESADGVPQPNTGLIVRFDGRNWLDELGQNWNARVGFSLPDKDVFEIDATADLPVELRSFSSVGTTLFNLAVNPVSGAVYVSNNDARNQVRFAGIPNRAATSVRGNLADNRITVLNNGPVQRLHLNKHLDFSQDFGTEADRNTSLSTPMQMAISADGETLYLAAFGSSKVGIFNVDALETDSFVPNSADHIELSAGGPAGIVLAEQDGRAYVYTRFDNGVSVIDLERRSEIGHFSMHNPEPEHVIKGRPFFYDARLTSGFGNDSCATCHVFGNTDGLAWDLGDPEGSVRPNPNSYHPLTAASPNLSFQFHPMKGPMTTQSMRGLPRHGPMHWRGDRTGQDRQPGESLEEASFKEFNEAFQGLMARDSQLDEEQMQAFTDFSLELTYPPNPIRALDQSLTAQQAEGERLYHQGVLRANGANEICVPCHVINEKEGIYGTTGQTSDNSQTGERDFKIPHFRDQYQKIGSFSASRGQPFVGGPQIKGFGFNHNGATHTTNVFDEFGVSNATLEALRSFLFAFPSESAPILGQQITLRHDNQETVATRLELLMQRAAVSEPIPECDLVVHGAVDGKMRGWLMTDNGEFVADEADADRLSIAQLREIATVPGQQLTFTCAPWGSGLRIAIDRDQDGVANFSESLQGSSTTDAASTSFNPLGGLWYNRQRQGHGIDLQRSGDRLVVTWYTYDDDATPVWYQAQGPLNRSWRGDLQKFTWDPALGSALPVVVGEMRMEFQDKAHAQLSWQLGERSGSEPFERFLFSEDLTLRAYTGVWFDPDEPGWGLSVDSLGDTRVLVAYFYDAANQPRWALGQSDNEPNGVTAMNSFIGFCPDCELSTPLAGDGGQVEIGFEQLRSANLDLSVQYPGLSNSQWRRDTRIQPLSDPVNLP